MLPEISIDQTTTFLLHSTWSQDDYLTDASLSDGFTLLQFNTRVSHHLVALFKLCVLVSGATRSRSSELAFLVAFNLPLLVQGISVGIKLWRILQAYSKDFLLALCAALLLCRVNL